MDLTQIYSSIPSYYSDEVHSNSDSDENRWIFITVGIIFALGSLLAVACLYPSLGPRSFAVGAFEITCTLACILIGHKHLQQERNEQGNPSEALIPAQPQEVPFPPLQNLQLEENHPLLEPIDREPFSTRRLGMTFDDRSLLNLPLKAFTNSLEQLSIVASYPNRRAQVQTIAIRIDALDKAIQLKKRFEQLGYPNSLTVRELLPDWQHSRLRFDLMMDDELAQLNVIRFSQQDNHMFFQSIAPQRIIALSKCTSFNPNRVPDSFRMIVMRKNINDYVTHAVRIKSRELSISIANLSGDLVIEYQKHNAIHLVSPAIYQFEMVGWASQATSALTGRFMKLDPEKVRLIFQSPRIDTAFTALRVTNAVSVGTTGLYQVGRQFASDTWDVARAAGQFMGLPNPMDYVPKTLKKGGTWTVNAISGGINAISGGLLPFLVETVMNASNLDGYIQATLDEGLPEMFANLDELLEQIDSGEMCKIFLKSLAKSIQIEEAVRRDQARFDCLTPNEKLFLILEHCRGHEISIPGISEERFRSLGAEEALNGAIQNYIENQLYPSLFPMIIPDYIEALSHFFGVLLDMPDQDALKPSLTYLLSETVLKTFSDPEQFRLFVLKTLGGSVPTNEERLHFVDETEVQQVLDCWVINQPRPLAREALESLKARDLVHSEAIEAPLKNGLKSRVNLFIGQRVIALSQSSSWRLAHLFFLETLRLYLETKHQVMKIEKLPDGEQRQEDIVVLQEQLGDSMRVEEPETTTILDRLMQQSLGQIRGKIASEATNVIIRHFQSIRDKISDPFNNVDFKHFLYEYGKSLILFNTKKLFKKLCILFGARSKQEQQVVELFLKGYLNKYAHSLTNEMDSKKIPNAVDDYIERLIAIQDDDQLLIEMKKTLLKVYS